VTDPICLPIRKATRVREDQVIASPLLDLLRIARDDGLLPVPIQREQFRARGLLLLFGAGCRTYCDQQAQQYASSHHPISPRRTASAVRLVATMRKTGVASNPFSTRRWGTRSAWNRRPRWAQRRAHGATRARPHRWRGTPQGVERWRAPLLPHGGGYTNAAVRNCSRTAIVRSSPRCSIATTARLSPRLRLDLASRVRQRHGSSTTTRPAHLAPLRAPHSLRGEFGPSRGVVASPL